MVPEPTMPAARTGPRGSSRRAGQYATALALGEEHVDGAAAFGRVLGTIGQLFLEQQALRQRCNDTEACTASMAVNPATRLANSRSARARMRAKISSVAVDGSTAALRGSETRAGPTGQQFVHRVYCP